MIATRQTKLPFVIFQIKDGMYAVEAKNVREIVRLTQVTSVANTPPEIRGVSNLRGNLIRLIKPSCLSAISIFPTLAQSTEPE